MRDYQPKRIGLLLVPYTFHRKGNAVETRIIRKFRIGKKPNLRIGLRYNYLEVAKNFIILAKNAFLNPKFLQTRTTKNRIVIR